MSIDGDEIILERLVDLGEKVDLLIDAQIEHTKLFQLIEIRLDAQRTMIDALKKDE